MNLPHWLDPTPATRALIATFAALPVREPFFHQRKQLKTGVPFKRAAQISNEARKQALLDELKATGETLAERMKRKQREWRKAQRQRYWEERKALLTNALRVGGAGEESSSPEAGAE